MTNPSSYKSSPTGGRIARLLETGFSGSAAEIAERVHCVTIVARLYLSGMIEDGAAHVCAWRRNVRGPYIAVYMAGKGKTPPAPAKLTNSEKAKRYKRRLREHLGPTVARAVLNGMKSENRASAIIIGGVTVWRRGVGVDRSVEVEA